MTIKETFDNITNQLVERLKKDGIPSKFIVREWGDRLVLADVVIMSEVYQTPIAVFEVKINNDRNSVESGIKNLRRIATKIKITAPCYLVCGNTKEDIDIFNVSQFIYSQKPFDYSTFDKSCLVGKIPDFASLQNDIPGRNSAIVDEKRQEHGKVLLRLCFWFIPAYCFIVLILDALNIFSITFERLIVHGAIIIITMLPFVSELSMAGVYLKLRDSGDKDKK